ncbi:hypothetical protein TWF718_009836 [Orbilia javanica]|uniref:DNA2/NAM7 helicase-like C-terminal domain-containing protein n=1 Tax=Orbilia javanica TaxID=47235 RepID=A0AAN8MJJ8_9PEZI
MEVDDKDATSFFKFCHGIDGTRISHELVEGDGGKEIQLDTEYYMGQAIRPRGQIARIDQMDGDVLAAVERFGAGSQDAGRPPSSISIRLKGWDRIALKQVVLIKIHRIPILGTSLSEKLENFRNKATSSEAKRKKVTGFCEEADDDVEGDSVAAGPLSVRWAILKTNYRSRAGIVNLISRNFYGQLKATRPDNPQGGIFNWYFNSNERHEGVSTACPLAVLWQDIARQSEGQKTQTCSRYNRSSIHHIIDILAFLEALAPDIKGEDVAVIAMYSAQVALLRRAVAEFLTGLMKNFDIGIVDSF